MIAVFKKVYHGIALLALLNLAVVGALIGYLASSGRLTAEQVEQIAAVLRGQMPEPQEARAESAEDVAAPRKSAESIDQEQMDEELARMRADRRRAELQQQAATIASARLEVTRAREALERSRAEFTAQAKKREKKEESESFKKELDLLSSLKPKVAVGYLLDKPPEDAAALLLVMQTRKAKRLMEAARAPAQKRAMSEILQAMREMSPGQAESLIKRSK